MEVERAVQEYMAPLSDAEPCGPNLEYDPEYVSLLTKMIPKGEAQYGDFVKIPEAPNWREIERDCRRMLSRTRDITILLLFLRCRIHLEEAQGLREGLVLLLGWLERYPDHVHPQLQIEGEADPTVRANALLALTDPEGIFGDLREIVLSKSSAARLQIRDVERAFAIPRPSDALSPDSVQRQLDDLYRSEDANLIALTDAAHVAQSLQDWLHEHMRDDTPDLKNFFRLLTPFQRQVEAKSIFPWKNHKEHQDEPVSPQTSPPNVILQPDTPEQAREKALQSIRNAREWFEQYEPSSPIPVLLRQAERMVGKKFHEVAQSIPSDLLERWTQDNS
jgi:type VI secretion system protein ImpA